MEDNNSQKISHKYPFIIPQVNIISNEQNKLTPSLVYYHFNDEKLPDSLENSPAFHISLSNNGQNISNITSDNSQIKILDYHLENKNNTPILSIRINNNPLKQNSNGHRSTQFNEISQRNESIRTLLGDSTNSPSPSLGVKSYEFCPPNLHSYSYRTPSPLSSTSPITPILKDTNLTHCISNHYFVSDKPNARVTPFMRHFDNVHNINDTQALLTSFQEQLQEIVDLSIHNMHAQVEQLTQKYLKIFQSNINKAHPIKKQSPS